MCVCIYVCVCVCAYALDTVNTFGLFVLQRTDVSVAHVRIELLALTLRPDTHAHVLVVTRAFFVRVSRA